MGFDIGGAMSGAGTGAMIGGPWGALIGGAAGGFLGGGGRGGSMGGYGMLSTEQQMGVDLLRKNLYADTPDRPWNDAYQYYGDGQIGKWREQLLGAAQTTSNPILRSVSEQVEADFARRGLSTGGAAGAAKSRALMDIAAKIVLPVEQEMVNTEKQAIDKRNELRHYFLNLALGQGGSYPREVQTQGTQSPIMTVLGNKDFMGAMGGVDWGGMFGGGGNSYGLGKPGGGGNTAASFRPVGGSLVGGG